jgi:hypothetical protein
MSELERLAVQRVIDQATALGVDVPADIHEIAAKCAAGATPGGWWVEQNPGVDYTPGCCWGESLRGPDGCTCWTPVYNVDQAPPQPDGDLQIRDSRCDDCAFRQDSPERANEVMEQALYALADTGQPFWCHDGMRRPHHWVHPDGRTVPGDPHDWRPPVADQIAYRANGQPGLLCAGWAARARRRDPGWSTTVNAQVATVIPARISMALDRCGLDGPDVDLACGTWEGNPAGDVDMWELALAAPAPTQLAALAALTGHPIAWFLRPLPPGPLLAGPATVCWRSGPKGGGRRRCTTVQPDVVDEHGVLLYGGQPRTPPNPQGALF